jgi:hypothetical protein
MKKPTIQPPKLYTWSIYHIKGTPAALLGRVEAADEDTAIKKAIEEFKISPVSHFGGPVWRSGTSCTNRCAPSGWPPQPAPLSSGVVEHRPGQWQWHSVLRLAATSPKLVDALFGRHFRGSLACLFKQEVDLLLHFFNGSGDLLLRRRLYRLQLLPHHLDLEQDFSRQGVNRVGGHMVIPWFVG